MQHGVSVGEYVLGSDGIVLVALPELAQSPLGDVVEPLPIRRVTVEGESKSGRVSFACSVPATLDHPVLEGHTLQANETIPAILDTLDLARSEGNLLFAAMHLVAYTGMRRGEAMGLLWDHVDLQEGTIRVMVQTRTGVIQEPPKTASGRRIVDLDTRTVAVVEEHRRRQAETWDTMGEMVTGRRWVFADELGVPISPKRLYDTVKRYGERVGHPEMTAGAFATSMPR